METITRGWTGIGAFVARLRAEADRREALAEVLRQTAREQRTVVAAIEARGVDDGDAIETRDCEA